MKTPKGKRIRNREMQHQH